MGAAMIGVGAGWTDWARGFGFVALDWAVRTAFLSVATGVAGMAVAFAAGFARLRGPAVLALAITAATFGAYAWMRSAGVTSPPLGG